MSDKGKEKSTLPTLGKIGDKPEPDLPMPGLEPNPAVALVAADQERAIAKFADAEGLLGRPYNFDEQTALMKADWQEAQAHAEASMYKVLQVGKRLAVIQEMEGPHWIQKSVSAYTFCGISERQAHRAVQMFREYGDAPALPKLLEMGSSKLLQLVSLPEEIKEEFKETGMLGGDDVAKMSWRELRLKIKELRKEKEELEETVTELKEEAEQGSEQLAKLEQELAEAKSGKKATPPDDAEAMEDLQALRAKFAELEFELTTMPFEELGEDVQLFAKTVIEEMRAKTILLEAHIDRRCGIYTRLHNQVLPVDEDMASDEVKAAEKTYGKPVKHKGKK